MPTTYNCTSSTYDSLLAASNGNAGSVLGLPLIRKLAGKGKAANPSMFLNLLMGKAPYIGSGLKGRTAGPKLGSPVDEYEWTTKTDTKGRRGKQQRGGKEEGMRCDDRVLSIAQKEESEC